MNFFCATDWFRIFATKWLRIMRKIKVQVQMTMNGMMHAKDGAMDWMKLPWSADLESYVQEITDSADTLLLGRKLAEGFIPYWQSVADDSSHPEQAAGKKFSTMRRIVFSKSQTELPFTGVEVAQDLATTVQQLRSEPGGDIMVYGGTDLVNAVVAQSLADEIHLFINPTVIANGSGVFDQVRSMQHYGLLNVFVAACGIVVLVYKPLSYA